MEMGDDPRPHQLSVWWLFGRMPLRQLSPRIVKIQVLKPTL
jgi:hypothetical protein